MKSPRSLLLPAALLWAAALIAPTPTWAQGETTTTLAAAGLRIIPVHHHLLWTFNDTDNPSDPTTGFFVSFYLNADAQANYQPETLTLNWLNPGPEGYLRPPSAGVTTGTVTSGRLPDGWTSYRFAALVQGTSTRIWDARLRQRPAGAETAQGTSRIDFGVSYDLSAPLSQVDPYIRSVLGPKAHETRELAAQGIRIRNFSLSIQADGSGISLSHPGQSASWSLGNVFQSSRGIAIGNFSLTPQ
jgi:hypothetical protein